ncbi:MAG: hypothetical protein U0324_03470 [Polyangiales bacterium]
MDEVNGVHAQEARSRLRRDAGSDAADVRDVTDVADVRDAAVDTAVVVDAVTTTTGVPAAPTTAGTTVAPAIGQLSVRQVPVVAGPAGVRAFPGAVGFGAVATGGRGGRVIYVTTLAPSGPGSLAEALAATGPRYVLFKVSGLINASVRVASGDVTVAGQTSPGGVIVRGIRTDESNWCDSRCGAGVRGVDNVILRHLRARPAPFAAADTLVEADGVRIRNSRRVVVDHVSAENAVDEAFEISYSNNVTVQDSIVAETVGGHAQYGGMLVNYSNPAGGYQLDALTVVRTAWVRIRGRYPELTREGDAAGSAMRVELSNNLLWGEEFYVATANTNGVDAWSGQPVSFLLNWVGNVGYAKPSYPYGMLWLENATGLSRVFFSDDHLSTQPARADWQLNYCCSDFAQAPAPTRPAWAIAARHDFPAPTYLASASVRPYLVAHAGAFPRDPMDRRLMGYVAAGVVPSSAPDVNPANDARLTDWGAGSPPAAPADADADGMPDAWERAHGTNPAAQDHNGTSVGPTVAGMTGYTNLEVYLAELAQQRLSEGPWGR